jgi:Signal transduction histidine kinase
MLIAAISDLIIFILTVISAAFSKYTYMEMLLGGLVMILVTAGCLTDGHRKMMIILQLSVAVIFAFLSGGWWGFIVFACIIDIRLYLTALLSGAGFIVYYISMMNIQEKLSGYSVALGIGELILITLIDIIIVAIRRIIVSADEKRYEEEKRMTSYSLREMYEIKRNRELSQQSFYIDKNARLVERENISRNIHNSVGHSITAAIMTLDAADMLFDKKPEEAHKRMNDAADRIRGSLESIRSAVRALDSEDADVSVKDMICYTDNILDEFMMDTDRTCDRIYDMYSEDILIPKEHVEFLTGALSEMLTNGVKHGGATHFTVKLTGDSAHIRLDVRDNGESDFDDESRDELIQKGFGLKKLMAYADRCGGVTEFRNDNGFASMIELPISNVID